VTGNRTIALPLSGRTRSISNRIVVVLPGPVRTDETEGLTAADVEVKVKVEHAVIVAVVLRQTGAHDR